MRQNRVVLCLIICLACAACKGGGSSSAASSSSTADATSALASSSIDSSTYAASVATSASTYDASDVVENQTFDTTLVIDFSANTAKLSSDAAAQSITTSGLTFSVNSASVVVAATTYGVTITSTAAGVKYELSGSLSGTLIVNSSSAYELYLNGLAVTASAGPAFDLESTQKAFIVTAANTSNTLVDSATRSLTQKAALYGKGPMIFSGAGELGVTASYKHGIFSNDYIRVRGGNLAVAVSARDAVRTVNAFIFDDGELSIDATGTTTDDESKGVKVEGAESSAGAGKGYVVINGGYITISSVSKAITANWDIDEDASTAATTDDPDPYVVINNGVIDITTTGTSYEYTSNGTTVSCSPEGIEAKADLTVNSGYLTISTSDDGLNAGSNMYLKGGYIYCISSDNDAIDANGNLAISGGVIVALGSGAPEGSFDYDDDDASTTNTFTITGGTFVGIGGNTAKPTSCSQNVVVLGSYASGTTLALKSAAGTTAFAFTIPYSYATMILSSPELSNSTTYTVYTGGTAAADGSFVGLFLGNLSYTGGTAGSSFTTSSRLTRIGGAYF